MQSIPLPAILSKIVAGKRKMDAPHISMFVGIGFIILQAVLSKIHNPKKKYASLDDGELFQTNAFNRRFSIFSLILALSLPLLFGLMFKAVKSMPDNVVTGLISVAIFAILTVVSTGLHYWQLAGIGRAEIEYRKFKKETANQASRHSTTL